MGPITILALLCPLGLGPGQLASQQEPQETQEAGPRLPARDAELQRSIGLVMQVGVRLSPRESRAELDRLEQLAGDDYGRLVPQLFLFSKAAKSTREAMAFGVIVSRLRISEGSVLRSLVPLLEVRDQATRQALAGYLSEYEGASDERRPSFEHYRDFLAQPLAVKQPLPSGLTRYLFERDAGQAVLLMMSVHRASQSERKEIRWSEHRIADVLWQEAFRYRQPGTPDAEAGRELNRMALHPAWYARRYAVEVLAKAPHLGERGWLVKLAEDPHARVREAASRALAPPSDK